MIDEDWLKSLKFTGANGLRFEGLLGVGSEKVVFKVLAPDGAKLAVKTYKHHLGYHIREIPLLLSGQPLYNLERVNKKLSSLVGAPDLDEMTCEYDRLFCSMLNILHSTENTAGENGAAMAAFISVLAFAVSPSSPEALPFLFCTPATKRRLDEIASLPPGDPNDPLTWLLTVNGPNFPITAHQTALTRWARQMLKAQETAKQNASLEPGTLADNPMYVWGAAAMDGLFTDEELPLVAKHIESTYGRLPSHPRVAVMLDQITAIADLLACALKDSKVTRLVKLCGLLGFMFDVLDRDGHVVASSMNPASLGKGRAK